MIVVWGSVETAAADYAEVIRLSLEHVSRSRREPGCISHNVSIDAENQYCLNFFEEWEDLNALHRHFEVDASVVFATQLRELSVRPPEIRIFDASRVR